MDEDDCTASASDSKSSGGSDDESCFNVVVSENAIKDTTSIFSEDVDRCEQISYLSVARTLSGLGEGGLPSEEKAIMDCNDREGAQVM